MKTLKKVPIEIRHVYNVPDELEEGIFYYSPEYQLAVHSCLCGCKQEVVTPIKDGEWSLLIAEDTLITVSPSIQQRQGCQSHYIINRGIANFV